TSWLPDRAGTLSGQSDPGLHTPWRSPSHSHMRYSVRRSGHDHGLRSQQPGTAQVTAELRRNIAVRLLVGHDVIHVTEVRTAQTQTVSRNGRLAEGHEVGELHWMLLYTSMSRSANSV